MPAAKAPSVSHSNVRTSNIHANQVLATTRKEDLLGAREKLNSVFAVMIVGISLMAGLLFQSSLIAILVGGVLIWIAINSRDIRLNRPIR